QRFATGISMPGYTGANNDTAAVVAYLTGRNTLVNSPTATATSGVGIDTGALGYTNAGASCTQPVLTQLNPLGNAPRATAVAENVTPATGFWSASLDTSFAFARSVEAVSARAATAAVSFIADANDAARRVIAQATDEGHWRPIVARLEMAASGIGRGVQ